MIKKLLIALLILVAVVLAGLLLLPQIVPENRVKALLAEQVEAATGRTLAIDGRLEWNILPRLRLEAGDITLSNPPGFEGEPFLEAGRLSVSVALLPLLSDRLEIGDVTVESARLRLLTDAAGRSNLEGLAGGDTTGAGDTPELSTGTITLRDAELIMADARTGSRDNYRLDFFELEPFRFNRPVAFGLSGRIGDPPILADLEMSGKVTVPASAGSIRLEALELSGRAAGANLPVRLTGEVALETGPPATIHLSNGRLNLDGDEAALTFEFRQGDPSRATARLEAEEIDLDRILAAMGDTGGDPEPSDDKSAPGADHPLVFLRDLNLDAGLEIGLLQVSGLAIESARAGARSRGGVLTLDPVRGDLAGGVFRARVRVDARPAVPEIHIEPHFEVPSLGQALSAWGLAEHVEGGGSLEMALDARGLQPTAILESLTGSGRFSLTDGRIKGLDLGALAEGVRQRDPGRVVAAIGGQTDFSAFNSGLRIRDGELALPDLRIRTDSLDMGGSLALGLSGLGLDGTLRFDREELQRFPLAVSGTLSDPELSLDVEGAAREELGRRLLEALEDDRDDEAADEGAAEEGESDAGPVEGSGGG